MRFLLRLLAFVFGPSLARLEREASEYGKLTLSHVELPQGLGWHCSLRPSAPSAGNYSRAPRYAWTATGESIREAIAGALAQAKGNPMRKIEGTPCVPRLGGAEFDPEPGDRS